MRLLFLSTITLILITSKSFSQCSFDDYAKYVDQNCFNCTILQQDSVVRKHIFLSNALLIKIHNNFYDKLKNDYNGTQKQKIELRTKYEKVYKDLKKSRSEVLSFYRFLGKNSNSGSNELMAYWFYTDKIIAILKDVQESLFGDDFS